MGLELMKRPGEIVLNKNREHASEVLSCPQKARKRSGTPQEVHKESKRGTQEV